MYTKTKKYTAGKKSAYGYDVGTTSTKIYDARQKRTDYAASLIDPELRLNVRIPDLACYQTATYCTEYHQPLSLINTATTTNNTLFQVFLAPCPTVFFHQGGTGTAPGDLSTGTTSFNIGDTQANYQAKYKSARLVSAIAKLTFAGNDTSTEGTVFATFFPADWGMVVPNVAQNLDYAIASKWANLPDYYSGPLRNGACVRYKPHDGASFDMFAVSQNLGASAVFGAFQFMVALPAATTGVTMHLDVVMNWEAILTSTVTGIPQAISGADPGALAHGLNAAAASDSSFAANPMSWQKNVDSILRQVA